jgi:hypothetical protein
MWLLRTAAAVQRFVRAWEAAAAPVVKDSGNESAVREPLQLLGPEPWRLPETLPPLEPRWLPAPPVWQKGRESWLADVLTGYHTRGEKGGRKGTP